MATTEFVICATDGCATIFKKKCNRHKYCKACAAERQKGYFKTWYYKHGGDNYCHDKYMAKKGTAHVSIEE